MSRWIDAANQHPFKKSWETLLAAVHEQVIDETTSVNVVEEIGRLNKVLAFVDNIISTIDAELIPLSIFANCQQNSDNCLQNIRNYQSSKSFDYLLQANEYADMLMAHLRPYLAIPEQYLKAYAISQKTYIEQVNKYIGSFEQVAKKSQSALSVASGEATAQKKRIDDIEVRVKGFSDYIFATADDQASVENRVKSMVEKLSTDQKAVADLHDKLLVGPESTSQLIGGYQRDVEKMQQRLTELTNSSTQEHEELKQFYLRIFGPPIGSDGKGGLKQEIEERFKRLDFFESENQTRHNAMFEKVESLLPGATSAGLASAYKSLKDSFDKRIENYTIAFYCALAFLLISGLFMIFDFTRDGVQNSAAGAV